MYGYKNVKFVREFVRVQEEADITPKTQNKYGSVGLRGWLRHRSTSRKVEGSIPDGGNWDF